VDELARLRALVDARDAIAACLRDPELVLDVAAHQCLVVSGASGAVVELLDGERVTYRALAGTATADDVSGPGAVWVPIDDNGGRPVGRIVAFAAAPSQLDADDVASLATLAALVTTALGQARSACGAPPAASHDSLTGLPNRRVLADRVALALAGPSPVTLLVVEIEGDGVGDPARRLAAEAMTGVIRAGDTLARSGDDQFVLLCHDVAEPQVDVVATRLSRAVANAWPGLGARVEVVRAEPDEPAPRLLERAVS